jgi:hypothetical protein
MIDHINEIIFSTTINSTEKYIHYAFIILSSSIVLSILSSIIIYCIKQHRQRKLTMIQSLSKSDTTSENSTL